MCWGDLTNVPHPQPGTLGRELRTAGSWMVGWHRLRLLFQDWNCWLCLRPLALCALVPSEPASVPPTSAWVAFGVGPLGGVRVGGEHVWGLRGRIVPW